MKLSVVIVLSLVTSLVFSAEQTSTIQQSALNLSQALVDLQRAAQMTRTLLSQTDVQSTVLQYTKPRKRAEIDLLAMLTVLHIVQHPLETAEKRELLEPLEMLPIQCLLDETDSIPVARFYLRENYRGFLRTICTILKTQNFIDLNTPIEEAAGLRLKTINNRSTLLHIAAAQGLSTVCKALYMLDAGNRPDAASFYAIHHAAAHNQPHCCTAIIAHDPLQLNQLTESGSTPLHLAASKGCNKTVECLLGHNAEIDIQNHRKGVTPLHLAALQGHASTVALLLKNGACPGMLTSKRNTAFHCAARSGSVETLKLLQEQDRLKLIISENKFHNTPAHIAAQYGHEGAYMFLTQTDPRIEKIRNNDGKTPLECGTKKFEKAIKSLKH